MKPNDESVIGRRLRLIQALLGRRGGRGRMDGWVRVSKSGPIGTQIEIGPHAREILNRVNACTRELMERRNVCELVKPDRSRS